MVMTYEQINQNVYFLLYVATLTRYEGVSKSFWTGHMG